MFFQSKKTRIIIDPRSSYAYGSFYLYGLIQIFGEQCVSYSMQPFKNLCHPGWNLRFIIIKNFKETKYFIHTNDTWKIQQQDYDWCDVYGNVNANFTHCPKERFPKLVSLVPSFGISVFNTSKTMLLAIGNFLKAKEDILKQECWNKYDNCMEINYRKNIKHFFGKYYKTSINRMRYENYKNDENSVEDYVFFLSTLWYSNEENKNDEGVNLRRAWFIRSCKSIPNINFAGGLVGDTTSSVNKFADVAAERGIPMPEWIAQTKKSSFVFNTPAFWDCHGWKLGEYLALGKCILSNPLSNDLPAPLVKGINIHYAEPTPEAIDDAVKYLVSNPEYRNKLEKGAQQYWDKYGTPIESLKLLGI